MGHAPFSGELNFPLWAEPWVSFLVGFVFRPLLGGSVPQEGYATSLQCSWMAVIVHTLLSQKEDQGIKAQSMLLLRHRPRDEGERMNDLIEMIWIHALLAGLVALSSRVFMRACLAGQS